MDPRPIGFSGSMNEIPLQNQPISVVSNQPISFYANQECGARSTFHSTYAYPRFREFDGGPAGAMPSALATSSSVCREEDSLEDCEFSDAILGYITQILMEDDMEEKTCMLQESLDFQAAEKSFYDILGKKYPPSPGQNPSNFYRNGCSPEDNFYGSNPNCFGSIYSVDNFLVDNRLMANLGESYASHDLPSYSISSSSHSSSNSVITGLDGLMDSSNSTLQVSSTNGELQSICQFKKGVEEGTKFLPLEQGLCVDLEFAGTELQEHEVGNGFLVAKDEGGVSRIGFKGRRISDRDDADAEEERSNKQAAIYDDTPLRSEMFDMVLLSLPGQGHDHFAFLRHPLKKEQPKVSKIGKGCGRKRNNKKEIVDLRTLLTNCAQAVAADDHKSANEMLRQIRQHSSPFGDANQRLSHCFADALEARLAGTGSQIYKSLVRKRTSAADVLKAYRLYLAACPFRKVCNFIANRTILRESTNGMTIHVIDFGILYGFQWPTFIQRLSVLRGGIPKLRITGIEFPQPGFRPAERVEETGRRLAAYAEEFGISFEYKAIAKRWDTITVEELNIRSDEFLAVNCLNRAKNLLDETVATDSPRNVVLHLIRKINPELFIHGILNAAYNAPFFVTRFREALFHFSAMFDMLETVVPREDPERLLLEKEIFGREAFNVIACESWERVERPETYKQWHVRNLRAGFRQVPLEREAVNRAVGWVNSYYHRDFVIDGGSQWLLQGWKGRILYAISAWKPA